MDKRVVEKRKKVDDQASRKPEKKPRVRHLVWALSAVVAVVIIAIALSSGRRDTRLEVAPAEYSYQVVNTFPHDVRAFCQGLDFDGTTLFESTGKYGQSSVRRVQLETGRVEKQLNLDRRLFGEGLTLFDDKLIQLTWKRGLAYVYDAETLRLLNTFRYQGEGWGITHDGKHFVMSDGSDILRFLETDSFSVVKSIQVKDRGRSVSLLNELEYVEGEILANVWRSDRIAVIAPDTGKVKGWIDLTNLQTATLPEEAVLNGIAYGGGRLFVTGKYWPSLFEIRLRKN